MKLPLPLLLLDIETTGLCDDENSLVLEIGMARVSRQFELLNPQTWTVFHPASDLMRVSPWIQKTHGKNGLLSDCMIGERIARVEELCMQYLAGYAFVPGKVLVAGNSVWTDRVHLRRHMPALHSWFYHRNLDFSVFKETAKMFRIPEDEAGKVEDNHRARSGLYAALERFEYYYKLFIADAIYRKDERIED